MPLRLRPLLAALILTAVAAPAASAKLSATSLELLRAPLSSATAVKRTCSARPLPAGTPGVVAKTVAVPSGGLLDARLDGSPHGADWDLAVFDAVTGRLLNGSAAFGGNEVVMAAVTAGDVLTVQACRRSGGAGPIGLSVRDTVVSGNAPSARTLSLVSHPLRRHAPGRPPGRDGHRPQRDRARASHRRGAARRAPTPRSCAVPACATRSRSPTSSPTTGAPCARRSIRSPT